MPSIKDTLKIQKSRMRLFFKNSLNHSASLQLLGREAAGFFQDTR